MTEYALYELCTFITARLDETRTAALAAPPSTGTYDERAWVLRTVEAKRLIVANARTAIDQAWQDDANTRVLVLGLVSSILRHLARVYDTHPDYLQEWALWKK